LFVNQASDFKQKLKVAAASAPIIVKDAEQNRPLPPASFQSFLKARQDIPGVVLANHDQQFTNQ